MGYNGAFGFHNNATSFSGGLTYSGTWNALTNVPLLASGVGTSGEYYIVSVAGNTNLDGITDWLIGDWAIFNGTTWQKIDNSGISYQGNWDALTNTPTLTSSVGFDGHFYIVSVAGSTNLNGITNWLVGDWAIFTGGVWLKVDNTSGIGGSGTTNYVSKFTGGSSIGDSQIFDNGTNVGIGTILPAQKLEVNGNALIKTSFVGTISLFGDNYASFSHNSRAGTNDYSLLSENNGTTYLNAATGQSIKLRINNIDKAILDLDGNLGIGTITPTAKLHIKGIDSSSSNFALKVEDSASASLLLVRNDGRVNINNNTDYGYSETFSVKGHSVLNNDAQTFTDLVISNNNTFAGRLRYYIDRLEQSADRYVFYTKASVGLLDINAYGQKEASFKANVGIGGNFNPTARLQVQGIDATSSNFALKIDNSASTPLLYVSNKGNIGNLTSPATDIQFFMAGNGTNSYGYFSNGAFGVSNFCGSGGTNRAHFYSVNGGQSGLEIDFTNVIAYNRYGIVLSNIGVNSSDNIGINVNVANGANNYAVIVNNGLSGFGITAPTSKLHIRGVDATSSNYSLKVENSTFTNLFSIRNDGVIDVYGTITPRLQSIVSSVNVTPTNLNDEVVITAQAVGLTLVNPTGTAVQGQSMIIRIKDNGTAQTIAYDTQYRAIGVTLPTTTVINKIVYLGLIYNSTDTKWDVIGVSQEA